MVNNHLSFMKLILSHFVRKKHFTLNHFFSCRILRSDLSGSCFESPFQHEKGVSIRVAVGHSGGHQGGHLEGYSGGHLEGH